LIGENYLYRDIYGRGAGILGTTEDVVVAAVDGLPIKLSQENVRGGYLNFLRGII
jgi:hypothetical protein